MSDAELERQAIYEPVRIETYDPDWPARFREERDSLLALIPEFLEIEHIGSTAVIGLAAKPIIDIMASVEDMEVADRIVASLCLKGYLTSAEYNRTLGDRRWLMRHAHGRRTHHLHLILAGSEHWKACIRFRDILHCSSEIRERYVELKRRWATEHGEDRESYGNAKSEFIASTLASNR